MNKPDCVLVLTHLAYKKFPPFEPIEGPYSSVCGALSALVEDVSVLGIPLDGYENKLLCGNWNNKKNIKIPSFLGRFLLLKIIIDMALFSAFAIWWSLLNFNKKKVVLAIDPLSCLPLVVLKNVFHFKLIFHCVDFSLKRFNNIFMQRSYELADKLSSVYSDQVWVICESLKKYKKDSYGVNAYYVPNSVSYNPEIYNRGVNKRTGNKMVWTGTLLTEKQYKIFFQMLSTIQSEIRTDISFVIAPTKDHDKFEKFAKLYSLKRTKILRLNSRSEFQDMAATCDVGIAIYDEGFGSTEFIEPMKIWDFLLCGLPFVVSSEPSISKIIKQKKVVYLLSPKNSISNSKSLKVFLSPDQLSNKSKNCLKIAERFDIKQQVRMRLRMLS